MTTERGWMWFIKSDKFHVFFKTNSFVTNVQDTKDQLKIYINTRSRHTRK